MYVCLGRDAGCETGYLYMGANGWRVFPADYRAGSGQRVVTPARVDIQHQTLNSYGIEMG